MSSKSKEKGSRGERRIVNLLNIAGCNASRVPLSGALGGELAGDVWINGIAKRRLVAEVKSRRPSNIFWKKIPYFVKGKLLWLSVFSRSPQSRPTLLPRV